MAKRPNRAFSVYIDPSIKLSTRARASIAAAVGGAAAAQLADLDLKETVAFVPRIDWPGGMVLDLSRFLDRGQLQEIAEDVRGF